MAFPITSNITTTEVSSFSIYTTPTAYTSRFSTVFFFLIVINSVFIFLSLKNIIQDSLNSNPSFLENLKFPSPPLRNIVQDSRFLFFNEKNHMGFGGNFNETANFSDVNFSPSSPENHTLCQYPGKLNEDGFKFHQDSSRFSFLNEKNLNQLSPPPAAAAVNENHISLNSIECISGVSFTSWIHRDQNNLQVLLTCFKPENLLFNGYLQETENWLLEAFRINPRIHTNTRFPDNYSVLSGYSNYRKKIESVFIFAHLGYIKAAEVTTNELDWGQKAPKTETNPSFLIMPGNHTLRRHSNIAQSKLIGCLNENHIQNSSRFSFLNEKNHTSFNSISVGMDLKTNITCWMDDQKNLNQLSPAGCLKFTSPPQQDSVPTCSLSSYNNYRKRMIEFSVYGSVFIFAHLGYIKAEVLPSKTEEAPAYGCDSSQNKPKIQILKQAGNQNRDFKIKSLKAAAAAKRRIEKKEHDRNTRKQAFLIELAKRKKERAEEMKLILIKEEEQLKKKEKRKLVPQTNQKLKFESKQVKNAAISGNKHKSEKLGKNKKAAIATTEWFEIDQVYEYFDAPQWVDLSASVDPHDETDTWFCRPDCSHM